MPPRGNVAKLVHGNRLMISSPHSLTRLAFGAWVVWSVPLAATSFAAGDEQRATLQHLLEGETPPVVGGQTVDGAALRRLYQLRGYDLLWVGHADRVATLGAAFDSSSDD